MITTNGLNHLALRVKDPERTAQFYTALFNMEITRSSPDMTFLKTVGSTDMITLNRSEVDLTPDQGLVHFGFIVEPGQFDAALQTIQAQSLTIVSGPAERSEGRYVFIQDPDGYTVEIFECLSSSYA